METAQGEGTTEAGAGGRPALPCGRGCIRSLCGPPFRARAQHQEGMLRPFLIPPGKSQEAAPRKKPSRLSTVRALYSWSLCPELNWRPHPYQGCALPTELQRHGAPNAFCVSDEEAFSLIRPCLLYTSVWHHTVIRPVLLSGESFVFLICKGLPPWKTVENCCVGLRWRRLP